MLAEILMNIATLSPLFAILVAVIVYLISEKKKIITINREEREYYNSEISKLNDALRESEKDNLIVLNKLTQALDIMSTSNKSVHKDILNLKEYISLKLENLNKK